MIPAAADANDCSADHLVDFSALTTPGRYQLAVPALGRSRIFDIEEDVDLVFYREAIRFLTDAVLDRRGSFGQDEHAAGILETDSDRLSHGFAYATGSFLNSARLTELPSTVLHDQGIDLLRRYRASPDRSLVDNLFRLQVLTYLLAGRFAACPATTPTSLRSNAVSATSWRT